MLDYSDTWNGYWQQPDRMGESSFDDPSPIARQILATCGLGRILDIGCGMGALVRELLKQGADAYGMDVSPVAASHCENSTPGRFYAGSILSIPFRDDSFDTIISTDCLEHLAPDDVAQALREMHRVCRRNLFLRVATGPDRDGIWHLTVAKRDWWENAAFSAGFRKHPAYYMVNPFESLENDGYTISIPLEKIPDDICARHSLQHLQLERGLHMDMLRDSGARSDAHVVRYQWASKYIKPGDRVLDAACGLGYGSYVISSQSNAASVLGIDGSAYAIDYSRDNFEPIAPRLSFREGELPSALSAYPDRAFDAIVSFETLEHVEDPLALLGEFHRLLSPGGRIIVSVPNDWSDESGTDPNPYHLHVYDWGKLSAQIGGHFIVESAWQQIATQCKTMDDNKKWLRHPRQLREVPVDTRNPPISEWWLMTGMKSPIDAPHPYEERVFANIRPSGHPAIRYAEDFANPWLIHAIVNTGYRIKNSKALHSLAQKVVDSSRPGSADHAAALCVLAYQHLDNDPLPHERTQYLLEKIDGVIASPPQGAIGIRWAVSLGFVKGRLLQFIGDFDGAISSYCACASVDFTQFGVHLGTKATEALYHAGKLALASGRKDEAKHHWQEGLNLGRHLLSVNTRDIAINEDFPNRFHHGDGIREYTLAWDWIARCANGLHALQKGHGPIAPNELDVSFQADLQLVHRELIERTAELVATRAILAERSELLAERTKLLTEFRKTHLFFRIRRAINKLLESLRKKS